MFQGYSANLNPRLRKDGRGRSTSSHGNFSISFTVHRNINGYSSYLQFFSRKLVLSTGAKRRLQSPLAQRVQEIERVMSDSTIAQHLYHQHLQRSLRTATLLRSSSPTLGPQHPLYRVHRSFHCSPIQPAKFIFKKTFLVLPILPPREAFPHDAQCVPFILDREDRVVRVVLEPSPSRKVARRDAFLVHHERFQHDR